MSSILKSDLSDMQLRAKLEERVINDLLGPAGGEGEELIERNVRDRYLVGVLAPSKQGVEIAGGSAEEDEEEIPSLVDPLPEGGADTIEEGTAEMDVPVTLARFPSSFGMTFCVDGKTKAIAVHAFWGQYKREVREDRIDDPYSCKQRCTCPSCHQKRALLTAIHVAEEVCFPVAHRQVVFTIPKRLRLHARFDRTLLGKLCSCAWNCIKAEVQRLLGRDDVAPGMIGAIQTFGELLHWHPHVHALVTCGAFTCEGEFLEVPELDEQRLLAAWQEAVFALYLAEGKIETEVVENMRSWPHSGFSVDQSVLLAAGDRAGIERLVQYMTRCPFSLSRLVEVTSSGQVVYKAEKEACRPFPDPEDAGLGRGVKRNFQILSPLDFLTRVHAAHSGQGLASDPLLRLVFEQGTWDACEGRGSGARGRVAARVVRCRGGRGADTKPVEPDVGDADQAGVRGRSAGLSSMFWSDEGDRFHRGAAAGGDREDPASLRLVRSVAAKGAAGTRGVGPRRRAGGTHVHGRSDVLGHILILPAHGWAQGWCVPMAGSTLDFLRSGAVRQRREA